MAKTAPRAILLRGRGIHSEYPAGGTVTPGHFVILNGSGQYVVNTVDGGDQPLAIAVENDLIGKGIDDNYVSGDLVQAETCPPGAQVNALVAAAAAAIAKGARVQLHTDGTVKILGAGKPIGRCDVAVDNSAGGTPARILITLL